MTDPTIAVAVETTTPAPSIGTVRALFDVDTYFEEQRLHKMRLRKAIAANKRLILAALETAGITQVQVSYDGCGDSGQLESIVVTPMTEAADPFPEGQLAIQITEMRAEPQAIVKQQTIHEAIETMCFDILEAAQPGWEINEGSYGTFVFDVAADEITLAHSERIEETNDSAHVF